MTFDMTRLSALETSAEQAIARTVIYASLFDYPLSLPQLRQSLIEASLGEREIVEIYKGSEPLQNAVSFADGFFFPAGRDDLILERRRREARSRAFLEQHRRLLELVCALPYVRVVALSGSIAHLNLDRGGDLDLFVITRGRRVWSVTVAIVLLAKLLGCRRTVCANFVMADTRLAVDDQDLFTANQILHLKPLVGRRAFAGFLAANPFVRRFYPNLSPPTDADVPIRLAEAPILKRALEVALALPWACCEAACRLAYRRHLQRRAAQWQSPQNVRLETDRLKLHTRSHREPVLARFDLALSRVLARAADSACAVGATASSRSARRR